MLTIYRLIGPHDLADSGTQIKKKKNVLKHKRLCLLRILQVGVLTACDPSTLLYQERGSDNITCN